MTNQNKPEHILNIIVQGSDSKILLIKIGTLAVTFGTAKRGMRVGILPSRLHTVLNATTYPAKANVVVARRLNKCLLTKYRQKYYRYSFKNASCIVILRCYNEDA